MTGLIRGLDILVISTIVYLLYNNITPLGLSQTQITYNIKRGFLWALSCGMITGVAGITLFFFGINPLTLIHAQPPEKIVQLCIVGGIIGPVAEELFFRGMIYGYFRTLFSKSNDWIGIGLSLILSTVLFVAAHHGVAGLPLPQIVGGIIFCLAYELEKSLISPIIIHSSGNIALFSISLISS